MNRRPSNAGIPLHPVYDSEGMDTHASDAPPEAATRKSVTPTAPSPMAQRIRDAAKPPVTNSVQNLLIRNLKGNVIGKVGGSRVRLQNSIKAVVADLLEGMPVVDEDTMTGNVAVIPLPMGRGQDLRKEPCPCGSGKPKDECDCNKQTTTMDKMTKIMGGNEPIKGNRLRKITTIAGGL